MQGLVAYLIYRRAKEEFIYQETPDKERLGNWMRDQCKSELCKTYKNAADKVVKNFNNKIQRECPQKQHYLIGVTQNIVASFIWLVFSICIALSIYGFIPSVRSFMGSLLQK